MDLIELELPLAGFEINERSTKLGRGTRWDYDADLALFLPWYEARVEELRLVHGGEAFRILQDGGGRRVLNYAGACYIEGRRIHVRTLRLEIWGNRCPEQWLALVEGRDPEHWERWWT